MTPAEIAERAARPSQHQERTFALISSIAHELRTPLSALSASAEMLGTSDDPEDCKRFLAIIQRQTRRLTGIIDGMLEAYGAAATPRRASAPPDLRSLLEQARAEQQFVYPHHRFVLELEPAHEIEADERTLGIIVSNLLSNAAKYSPPGSTVRITCRPEGDVVRLRVQDQGSGVPEHMKRDIFEAGERAGRSVEPGFGLGLFVVYRLCEVLGAQIDVEDAIDSEGACFVLTLPQSKQTRE